MIVPACTFHASFDPVCNCGAQPVFADVDRRNLTLCPKDVANKITSKTKAIVVVHIFGIPADMRELKRVADEAKVDIVEDVSHAHGALVDSRICGVYPGFPTLFWGLSVFFVGDLMGKALWKLVENAARFPRRGGRVLCVHGAVSFHRARPCGPRWLPGRGAMRDVELDRRVLGLQSTGEYLCSRQNRRPVQAERSIDPGKTGISGTYAIWETRI